MPRKIKHTREWSNTLGMYIESNGEIVKEPDGLTAGKARDIVNKRTLVKKCVENINRYASNIHFYFTVHYVDRKIKSNAKQGFSGYSYVPTKDFFFIQKLQGHYTNKGFNTLVTSDETLGYSLNIKW